MGLAVENQPSVLTDGKLIALRRDRLGWKQETLAANAGVSLSTVLRVEKDKNVRRDIWLSIDRALQVEERTRGLSTSLDFGDQVSRLRHGSGLSGSVHPLSTNRENVPKGGEADDPATASTRELVARLDAQDRKIQALQNLLDSFVRSAAKQRGSGKAASDTPRRGKRDR